MNYGFLKEKCQQHVLSPVMLSTQLALTLLLSFVSASPSFPYSTAVTPFIAAQPPNNAVQVSPLLVSLSIEGDRWPDWAANGPSYAQRNQFFYNALENLKVRTGVWPRIRVGANSEDRTLYDDKIKVSPLWFDRSWAVLIPSVDFA